MGNSYGPKIVTDGLIFCGDPNAAGNDDGADGANGMMNLVDNARNVKSGSPTVATLGGVKCWKFNSTSQYYESGIIATADQPTTNATVEAWIYPQTSVVGTERGCVLRINNTNSLYHSWNKSNRKLSSYWYNHADQGSSGYHETGAAMALDTWHHTCAVWSYDDAKVYQYINMTKTSATTQGNNISGGYVEMGMESSDRQYTGGIGVVRIYNVALTDTQVEQNFNAQRSRFGL